LLDWQDIPRRDCTVRPSLKNQHLVVLSCLWYWTLTFSICTWFQPQQTQHCGKQCSVVIFSMYL